jgi:hypothetical protein
MLATFCPASRVVVCTLGFRPQTTTRSWTTWALRGFGFGAAGGVSRT